MRLNDEPCEPFNLTFVFPKSEKTETLSSFWGKSFLSIKFVSDTCITLLWLLCAVSGEIRGIKHKDAEMKGKYWVIVEVICIADVFFGGDN